MAKILKCPRCQEKIDVTDLSGGSTVKCDACGTMVRLASGGTQKIPAAAPPPPPAAPAAPGRKDRSTKVRAAGGGGGAGRQTDLFRKMSNAKAPGEKGRGGRGGGGGEQPKSNTGMIIAIAAAAIVVIGGGAFFALSGDGHGSGKASASEGKGKEKDSATGTKKKKKDEPRKADSTPLPPSDNGTFQPGALALVDKATTPMMKLNPEANAQYELMAGAGKVSEIVSADYRWVTYAINGLLSDNEAVAKSSMDAMHQIINKRKLDASQSDLAKKSIIGGFNLPGMRQNEYYYWATWWFTITAQNAVAEWRNAAGPDAAPVPGGGTSGNASSERWAETLSACKSGGFTNSANESYYHYQRIKSMGKSAYQPLINFIDNEDTGLGTAAVLVLKELSGRSDAPSRVNESNKAQIKADWEGWLKTSP